MVHKHLVLIDPGGQAVHLIIYEAVKGNSEGLCLALSQVNKGSICESYLSHMGIVVLCNKLFSGAQRRREFFNLHCFPRSQNSSKIHCWEASFVPFTWVV